MHVVIGFFVTNGNYMHRIEASILHTECYSVHLTLVWRTWSFIKYFVAGYLIFLFSSPTSGKLQCDLIVSAGTHWVIWFQAPAGVIVLCYCAGHFTLPVTHSVSLHSSVSMGTGELIPSRDRTDILSSGSENCS